VQVKELASLQISNGADWLRLVIAEEVAFTNEDRQGISVIDIRSN
jgi:hypothetical protein